MNAQLSINDCLLRIKCLVEGPHWSPDRKQRISELCDIAIAQLPNPTLKLSGNMLEIPLNREGEAKHENE